MEQLPDMQCELLEDLILTVAAETVRVFLPCVAVRDWTAPEIVTRFTFTDDDLDQELYR